MKKTILLISALFLVINCYSQQMQMTGNKIETNPDKTAGSEFKGCKNITDIILTNHSPYCKDYVGVYCAYVTDVNAFGGLDARTPSNSTVVSTQSSGIEHTANFSIEHIGDRCKWITDAIPNHNFNNSKGSKFPKRVQEQNYTFYVPDTPTEAEEKIPISLQYFNAILLNGALVDLLSDGCCCDGSTDPGYCGEIIGCKDISNPWRKDPMYKNGEFQTDTHNAHAQENGTYHYHGPPNALYELSGNSTSAVIGFAADGFPIYGPYVNINGTVREVRSSYQLKQGARPDDSCPTIKAGQTTYYNGKYIQDYKYVKGSGDLDEFNGMEIDGHYGYFVTSGYPYMIKFFKGIPDESFRKPVPARRRH